MIRSISIPAMAFLAGLAGPAAAAQPNLSIDRCSPRADMVVALQKNFREVPEAVGMVDQTAVVEVFVSDSGTWTLVATGTNGVSCIMSAGEGWESKTVVAGVDS